MSSFLQSNLDIHAQYYTEGQGNQACSSQQQAALQSALAALDSYMANLNPASLPLPNTLPRVPEARFGNNDLEEREGNAKCKGKNAKCKSGGGRSFGNARCWENLVIFRMNRQRISPSEGSGISRWAVIPRAAALSFALLDIYPSNSLKAGRIKHWPEWSGRTAYCLGHTRQIFITNLYFPEPTSTSVLPPTESTS